MPEPQKIGIIAGGGRFPLLLADAARKAGYSVVAVAHQGETIPELADRVDSLYWIRLGQLGKIIKHFKNEGVRETVLLGSITKTSIFRDVRPDLKALGLWNKIKSRQDDSILRAFADALEQEGITVVASTRFLAEHLLPKGLLTRKPPTPEQFKDIEFGWRMARAIGALDIGQCVVIRNRTVLAVEAIEGTDAAIRRGGTLGKEKTVVVKVRKPQQDFRFDLPAIGPATIESLAAVKASVLAVEAGQSLLIDPEETIKLADSNGIVLVGLTETADNRLEY